FQDPAFPAKVYKVEKSMYGLHQAPRAWYGTSSKYLLMNGFQRGTIDQTLFIIREFEALMHEKVQMSAMGELNLFLGLQVLQKEDGTFLSQDKYIGDILKKFGYLDGHPKLGLWYPKASPFDLAAYSDSDYGGASQDRKPTTGGSHFLGRRLISWQYKKQTIVATSTTEAEYVAAASCCGQVLWIQNQLLDYGFKDILGVTTSSDEAIGVEADVSNMETTILASLNPTLRIHKDHPKSQIIGPVDTPIQTKHKSKESLRRSLMLFKTQDPEYPARVYKVEKAMYGLHQAPTAWYGTLSKYLLSNGFQMGTIDQTFFIRRQRGNFILVEVYVDAIIFGSSNPQLCREFEALMHEKFQMSAMGELNFFLGLQVLQKEDGIFLSQDKYIGDILKKFRYSDVRYSNTPMDKENPWGKDGTGKDVDLHLYISMIGSLMYLTASRPDIMFAVYAYARHQVTPKDCHLHAVKRIFRYLKGHPKLGLWYPKESPFDLVAYSDSDYGGASQDRKSTTGGSQFLGRRLISWQCKKETIVATLTTEAEYVVAASCC
nr:putative ribonuclease H-like domain-containing protein [Tanacetum cinerariifolium]